jgi:hypothetical protein
MYEVRRIPTRHGRSLAQQASDILETHASLVLAGGQSPTVLSNWTSAMAALGLAHIAADLAAETLAAIFDGQWRNGLLPHQFAPDVDTETDTAGGTGSIWPSVAASTITNDRWGTRDISAAPGGMITSGLVHPPIHATVALRIAARLPGDEGLEFLGFLYPRLAAWHDYLMSSRTRSDVPLAEIWHPEESAMSGSIVWDSVLGGAEVRGAGIDGGDRADRLDALVADMRAHEYQPGVIRARTPFAVHSVVFNSLLARAELDLAEIAQRLGHSGNRHIDRSRRIATLINRELFDPHDAWFADVSVPGARRLPLASAAGLAPLFAGVPDPSRAALVADMRRALAARQSSPLAGLMGSADPEQPEFSLNDPWRGPAAVMTNWLGHDGLRAYGYAADAAAIRDSIIAATMREGFWEHFNVFDGNGCGATNVSPVTAAIVMDLLVTERTEPDAA